LQGCWNSAGSWCTSISAAIKFEQVGQAGLQEFWNSAQHCLTLISTTTTSKLSGKGDTPRSLTSHEPRIELRGVVKCLVFVCRHLALLALCHLVIRQTTRKSDILYTYRHFDYQKLKESASFQVSHNDMLSFEV